MLTALLFFLEGLQANKVPVSPVVFKVADLYPLYRWFLRIIIPKNMQIKSVKKHVLVNEQPEKKSREF